MKYKTIWLAALALAAFPATAQEREARAAQEAMEEAEVAAALAEAEAQLAEAAARVAELSTRSLPEVIRLEERIVATQGRPRLGVTIASDDPNSGPVEGVTIIGVTPGSAAADAGLRSGDVLTTVAEEPLGADTQAESNKRLLNIVLALEEGDKLDVEYLRDGNVGSVVVEPRVIEHMVFSFSGAPNIDISPNIEVLPGGGAGFIYDLGWHNSAWGDMELVELNEGLGKYFGTSEGILVVNAPKSGALRLEDGDVIQSIDGREPSSVNHTIRILTSYQPGEKLEIAIMREQRRLTLDVEMPDDRRSSLAPPAPPVAPLAPAAPMAPAAPVRKVIRANTVNEHST